MMNLLRRAAKESVRELGFNIPTLLTVILVIVFLIIITQVTSAPETDSRAGIVFGTIRYIALVVVFLPLLAWNVIKVARRDKTEREILRMTEKSSASLDDQMKSFISKSLSNPQYGVAKCYAFGSVVRRDPTRDVDIIIQFDSSKPRQIRHYRDRLRNVEKELPRSV